MKAITRKNSARALMVVLLVSLLSGCVLTKLVTTPMRLVGSAGAVVGSTLSIFPVVGNPMNDTFRDLNAAIDKVADGIDEVPL